MPHINKTYYSPKDIDVKIAEIYDGIYRISGFDEILGITYNQFLIDDEQPMLVHTGRTGMYKKIEEKVKEVIPLQKLTYVAFLHFESDEWGGMAFLESADAKLVCSDLSSKLNLTGWYNVPVDHMSFWDNETLKTGKKQFRFIMTPHVHHWDSMMIFEETTKSLFPSDLFIQPGEQPAVVREDLGKEMCELYRGAGIFAADKPVLDCVARIERLKPDWVHPMHGGSLRSETLRAYTAALRRYPFAYDGMLFGRAVPT